MKKKNGTTIRKVNSGFWRQTKRGRRGNALRLYVWMYGNTYSKSIYQPGKAANPVRGQLNKENKYFPLRVRA